MPRAERLGVVIRLSIAILALAVGAAACGSQDSQPPLGPVPDADMSLTANNQLDRPLELYVNGSKIADVQPGTEPTFQAKDLPQLPWTAELRLATGRTLLSLTIASGSVVRTATSAQGVGIRADLSCGRVELFAVLPLGGPVPGTGRPGDCGP
jgi:hypothetical protein